MLKEETKTETKTKTGGMLSRAVWEENCEGFTIFSMKAPMHGGGLYNGYILLEITHPMYSMDYDEADRYVDAHGGLTFGGMQPDGRMCFGFDCGHIEDTPENCDHEYVKSQCRLMAVACRKIQEEGLPND